MIAHRARSTKTTASPRTPCKIDPDVGASPSEELDRVDLDDDEGAAFLDERGSRGEQGRARSGTVLRSDARRHEADAFDDVTPTRSLAEVGLADMDEDLPTRMQTLDELARFRAAAANEPMERRDAVRPPAPEEPEVPAPTAGVSIAELAELDEIEVDLAPLEARPAAPEPAPAPDRSTRKLLAIAAALFALAAAALVAERLW